MLNHKLNPKQLSFIDFYLDPTKDTYGNGKASALAAGYSMKNPKQVAHKILKVPAVMAEIDRRRALDRAESKKTKEDAISEARANYELTTDARMKKFWYEMWVNLQGWLVQKTESTAKVEYSKAEEEQIDKVVREALAKDLRV